MSNSTGIVLWYAISKSREKSFRNLLTDTGKLSYCCRRVYAPYFIFIRQVGRYTPEQLRAIGIKLFELGGGEVRALLQGGIEELGRYNYGYQQVYGKALQHYGLSDVFRRIEKKSKLQFSLYDSIFLMLLERLQEPCSKRNSFFNQHEYVNLPAVALHHLYRALDKLAANNLLIQQQIFTQAEIYSIKN